VRYQQWQTALSARKIGLVNPDSYVGRTVVDRNL